MYISKKGLRNAKTFKIAKLTNGIETQHNELNFKEYENGENPISTSQNVSGLKLLKKIKNAGQELDTLANITRGVHPYRTGGYGKSFFTSGYQIQKDVDERPYHSVKQKKGYRPFIYGKDLKHLTKITPREFVSYGPWLAEPRDSNFFEGDRVYSRKILGARLVVTIEDSDSVADQQVYITKPKSKDISAIYLAAILGSKLISFFIRNYFDEVNDAFPQIKVSQLKSLPIIIINQSKSESHSITNKIRNTVTSLMELNSERETAISFPENEQIDRKIHHLQDSLDRLIYDLYALTPEEIVIVEGGANA